MTRCALLVVVAGLAGATPAGAADPDYPPPANPGSDSSGPAGPFRTRSVCAKGQTARCARTIQAAVDAAEPGDRVLVPDGVYRESVRVTGRGKRHIRLIGNPGAPGRVVLEGGGRRRIGIGVRWAGHVTIRGFTARGYAADGFRWTQAIGGVIADVRATGNGRAGFALGGMRARTRPVRTMVRRIRAEGNAVGLVGVGLRYATIAGSRLSGNGAGLLLAAAEDVVVAGNRMAGNLVGAAMFGSGDLVGNRFIDNAFDGNGRDFGYAGGGSGNCLSGNRFAGTTVPADGATFAACPFSGANPADAEAAAEIAGWWPGASR